MTWRDLTAEVFGEFAERQALAPLELSVTRVGLTFSQRSTPEYFVARRADLKARGRCANCPARIEHGTRCPACAAVRAAKERARRAGARA